VNWFPKHRFERKKKKNGRRSGKGRDNEKKEVGCEVKKSSLRHRKEKTNEERSSTKKLQWKCPPFKKIKKKKNRLGVPNLNKKARKNHNKKLGVAEKKKPKKNCQGSISGHEKTRKEGCKATGK